MACLITAGIIKDCDYLLGGLNKIWLFNRDEIASYTDTTPDDGIINAIVMVATKVGFAFDFDKNTGSFTNELTVSGGQKFVTQTVNFTCSAKNADIIAQLKDLSLATLTAVCEDRNGARYIVGRLNGVEATVTTLNSGAAEGDAAGIVITLSGAEIEYSPILDASFDISTIL